jgi:hypothetical protein
VSTEKTGQNQNKTENGVKPKFTSINPEGSHKSSNDASITIKSSELIHIQDHNLEKEDKISQNRLNAEDSDIK